MARVQVIRADDLLVCELELIGIDIAGAVPNRRLVPQPGANQLIVLHLPVQHQAEEAFVEHEPPLERVFLDTRAAGPSRVVFRVDPAGLPVDFTLSSILELLASSPLSVPASAARRQQPTGCLGIAGLLWYLFSPPALAAPSPIETAIELPFRLILSPDDQSGFAHESHPVTAPGGRTELWRSELRAASPDEDKQVRAMWLRQGEGPPWTPTDPLWSGPDGGDEPFELNTMSQRDRADIVHVSGNRRYALQSGTSYDPQPVDVRRLALTSLGGWLDVHGEWTPPISITSLIGWTHRATQGRDNYVRTEHAGFLYPFGHLATLVTISERKFLPRGRPGAGPHGDPPLLLQRQYIVVRQPTKTFLPGAAPSGHAHVMPFHQVRLRTLVTPDLSGSGDCFPIKQVGHAEPFDFAITGTDVEGNLVDLTTPLVWVLSVKAWDTGTIDVAKTQYAAPALPAHGRSVAFAPGPQGDTTYTTDSITFTAPPLTPMPALPKEAPEVLQPGFWPELVTAEVKAPALQILAGADASTTIRYHDSYRLNGLGGANLNEVFAERLATGAPLKVDFGGKGDRGGGLVQPSLDVAGLSRSLGPVGGDLGKVADLAAGKFDPSAFFAGAPGPKLFGVFELQQVLGIITGTTPGDVPRMAIEKLGDGQVARLVWKPEPVSYPTKNPLFVVDGATDMSVDVTFDAHSSTPSSVVDATLKAFRLHLLGDPTFLELHFDKIGFKAETGRKPDVDVVLGKVVFAGPLSFLEELKSIIPLDGFSDPPALDITPEGVRSSFSLALPDLAVGVFALQNLSLGAGFALPFVGGALTVNFEFCKREEPFSLTVSLFGGGGFFGLTIDPNGIQVLEAALEFGASCAINLGVAQGGVHVMAGIYFKMDSAKGCTLSGYLRLGGNMSVLGLISVSIELNLSFTYKEPDKAYGRAVVTVEIDIFLFSTSVEVECERQFAGSANDPPFRALMKPDAWREYCDAYA